MTIDSSSSENLTQQHIKFMHLRKIFIRVLWNKGLSRAQLKEEMQLSFPSVSALVEEMISGGLLYEAGANESNKRGRPSIQLQVNPEAFAVPVVNMTRDGYHYTLFNACAQPIRTGFIPYGRPEQVGENWQPETDMICEPLVNRITNFAKEHTICDVVFSIPGTVNSQGRLTSSALRIELPADFVDYIEKNTGLRVCMINDSDAEAFTERLMQPLPSDFIFIHVGKGVGAGVIRKGKIYDSSNVMRAGEIGHISIDYKGIPCSCGNRGCLERYICIPAICQEAAKILGQESADFETVCRAYAQGHAGIVEMLCGKARLLAVGISNLIAAHPVTHIVLGGGIEQLGDRFLEQVQQAVQTVGFRKYMNRLTVTYTVSPSGNGALGAVWNYMYHQMKIEHVLKK